MKNANFYSLFEFSPVAMWVYDVQTLSFLDVNLAAVQHYGYTKEQFLTMTISQLEDLSEAIEAEGKDAMAKEGLALHVHLRADGELIFVELESNPILYNERKARIVLANEVTDKIAIQRELLLSERRFRALVQDASDMITIIDKDFNYTYVSPASLRVFGIEPKSVIGSYAFDFIHSDDFDRVLQEAGEIWQQKQILLSPYRYRDVNGNWLWIETKATNLLDDPAVKGIVCISKDITKRIEDEQVLRENVERFNMVSKATSDVIWDCDFETKTIAWNKTICEVLGYDNLTLTSTKWWEDRIHPEDRDRVLDELEKQLQSDDDRWASEYRFYCGNNQYKYIFDRGFILKTPNGIPYRMIGSIQDISLRKQEEQWSRLLESVVTHADDGVLITDASVAPGPYIVYVNDALVRMSGFTRAELLGSSPAILHQRQEDQPEIAILYDALAKGEECRIDFINETKAGNLYNVSVTVCPVLDEKASISNWISIRRDITGQKQYIAAIEAQNKSLREIRWMQSHGVRAPLARIMSLVSLLHYTPDAAAQHELLNHLEKSAKELDVIVTQIANETPKL